MHIGQVAVRRHDHLTTATQFGEGGVTGSWFIIFEIRRDAERESDRLGVDILQDWL